MSYEFELDHWPDLSKSRSNYLPLLKLAVDEEPNDDRSAHYYGRELMFNGKYEEATCKYYLTPRMLEQFHESTNEEIAFLELARMNYYDKGKKQ
jgi:hypothetical protein